MSPPARLVRSAWWRALVVALLAAPLGAAAASLYDGWPNGPPKSPEFFPIAVWYQAPGAAGPYGRYADQASAAAGEHINIFLGFSGKAGGPRSWPEHFGHDEGELEAIKAHHLYAVVGLDTPTDENASPQSVASMLALAKSIGASANIIGYNAGDEPDCPKREAAPAAVRTLSSYDPTRLIVYNQIHWMTAPAYVKCLPASIATLQAASVASADFYPVTDPWIGNSLGFPKSDFLSVANDTLFMQGVMTEGLIHYARPGEPVWAFVESGSDNFGFSGHANFMDAGVESGSNVLTNASRWSVFTATWVGLKVSGAGIPANAKIVSIQDATHAVMSEAATATSPRERVTVTGGAHDSDCVARVNLCVVEGNEYRATPAQVNAEVWNSLISGANGIEWFCHDTASISFCLGNGRGDRAAVTVQENITYVDETVLKFAPVLNAPTVGMCSMQHQDYTTSARWTTTRTCANGVLTMTTGAATIPGLALVKTLNGVTYLLAQSDRRTSDGVMFTFKLNGSNSKTAKVVYDSNSRYDPPHSSQGRSIAIDRAGEFSDAFGADRDDYQVKIYAIN